MKYAAILLGLLLTPLVAVAQVAPETRWADPSYVELDVEFPGDGYHANWELFRCACGDLLVHSELDMPGDAEVGETLMVGRRAVLSRGFGDNQEEFGSSMDAPALMMQLALRLLERVQPAGPSAVREAVAVDATEEIMNLMLDTGTAAGGFQAPWSVKGKLAPAGETRRRFDLEFEGAYRNYDYPNAFAFHEPVAGPKTLETLDAEILATWRISRHFRLVAEIDFRETASTDTRIQYERTRYSLSVVWEL